MKPQLSNCGWEFQALDLSSYGPTVANPQYSMVSATHKSFIMALVEWLG